MGFFQPRNSAGDLKAVGADRRVVGEFMEWQRIARALVQRNFCLRHFDRRRHTCRETRDSSSEYVELDAVARCRSGACQTVALLAHILNCCNFRLDKRVTAFDRFNARQVLAEHVALAARSAVVARRSAIQVSLVTLQ